MIKYIILFSSILFSSCENNKTETPQNIDDKEIILELEEDKEITNELDSLKKDEVEIENLLKQIESIESE